MGPFGLDIQTIQTVGNFFYTDCPIVISAGFRSALFGNRLSTVSLLISFVEEKKKQNALNNSALSSRNHSSQRSSEFFGIPKSKIADWFSARSSVRFQILMRWSVGKLNCSGVDDVSSLISA